MTQPLPSAVLPGTKFGQYEVVRLIGEGGMGSVFEAVHTQLKKRVALKTLTPAGAMSADALARFLREGEMAAKIRHPNVVDITDVGIHENVPYLVMELLEGENLAARVGRGVLGIGDAVDLLFPVIAAVQTAHEEGVIHRDLKPHNIFLAAGRHGQWTVKLLDFGISKVTDPAKAGQELTHTQTMLGTPFYMSPEQVRGAKLLDAKTDQYSLGVIFYECLTGRVPFYHDQLFSLLTLITQGTYPALSLLRPDIPPEFERVIARAMHIDKDARFSSVAELGSALVPFAGLSAKAQWASIFSQQVVSGALTSHSGAVTPPPGAMTPPPDGSVVPGAQARTNGSLSATNPPKVGGSRAWLWGLGAVGLALAVAASLRLAGADGTAAETLPAPAAPPSAVEPPPVATPVAAAPSAAIKVEPEPVQSAVEPPTPPPAPVKVRRVGSGASSAPRPVTKAPRTAAPAAAAVAPETPKRSANQAPILR